MWFWIGLLILAISFFLEFTPAKNWLKKKLPSFSEGYWHVLVFVIFITGLVTAIINHSKEEQQSSNIQTTISDIQKGIRHVAA